MVVGMAWRAHQEWLENGTVILSNVLTLSLVEPREIEGKLALLCEGHPHLAGRPLLLGDRLSFLLPSQWRKSDLWFHRLEGVEFASGSRVEEAAETPASGADP